MDGGKPRVGALLEVDHMYFSRNNRGLLPKSKNRGFQGLMVVIEVLTGYTQVAAFKTTKQQETVPALRAILQKFKSVMKLKGSTI